MFVLVSPSKPKRNAKAPASKTKSSGKTTGRNNCKGRTKPSPKPKPKPKSIETSIPLRPRTDIPTPIGSPPPPYTVTAPIPSPFVPRLQPQHTSNVPPVPYRYLPKPPVPELPPDRAWVQAFTGKSCTDLREIVTRPIQNTIDDINDLQHKGVELLNHKTPICDLISSKFNAVITSIDGEIFSGDEKELGTRNLLHTHQFEQALIFHSDLPTSRTRTPRRLGQYRPRSLQDSQQCHLFGRCEPTQHELLRQGQSLRQLETTAISPTFQAVSTLNTLSMVAVLKSIFTGSSMLIL